VQIAVKLRQLNPTHNFFAVSLRLDYLFCCLHDACAVDWPWNVWLGYLKNGYGTGKSVMLTKDLPQPVDLVTISYNLK